MLAVLALGALLWMLSEQSPTAPASTKKVTPKPSPPVLPKKPLQPANYDEAKRWVKLPSPVPLKPGAQYRAEIHLSGFEALASNDSVASQLNRAGPWKNLTVVGSGGTRTATGVYSGAAAIRTLPPQVTSVSVLQ